MTLRSRSGRLGSGGGLTPRGVLGEDREDGENFLVPGGKPDVNLNQSREEFREREPMRRDTTLFAILIEEHTPMLLTYLRVLLPDGHAIDDLYQETMMTAWRRLGDFDRSRPFGAWIRGIARNHVWEHRRRREREAARLDEAQIEHLEERISGIEKRPGDTWQEKLDVLDECLRDLPNDLQDTVHLHYREGMTTDKIALSVAASREAVKKRLQRARTWLYHCLQRKRVLLDSEGAGP